VHIIDHIFILLIFIVLPIFSAYDARLYIARAKAGLIDGPVRAYVVTMQIQWVFFAALAIAWWTLDRPIAALGFVAIDGIELWGGVAALAVLTIVFIIAWQLAKRLNDEDRAKQTAGLGSLIYFLPHSRRELRYFYAVSITAGVVEEIVYRGFLIWYFGMFMPLWLAVLVSSIGFGLAHSYQGLGGVLKVCVIGLIFAALYILTGSIIIPIIAHMIVDVLQGLAIIEVLGEQDATPAAV
jgi:membrane protease YdiL (CAAX protease family)